MVALVVAAHTPALTPFSRFATGLAVIVGGITLSGSLVAAAKLHGRLPPQRPFHLRLHNLYLWGTGAAVLAAWAASSLAFGPPLLAGLALAAASLAFGALFTIRLGGADMPITISLLNSLSGGSGGSCRFPPLANLLLVAVGAVVGASGLILTQIMCRAMNRSLWQILLGRTTVAVKTTPPSMAVLSEPKSQEWQESLGTAQRIAIIPGYGLALAQAQLSVKQLADELQALGREVRFGIHPVAGRMPGGHMNVLLAEADVDYGQLYDLEEINDYLQTADLAIVIGGQ